MHMHMQTVSASRLQSTSAAAWLQSQESFERVTSVGSEAPMYQGTGYRVHGPEASLYQPSRFNLVTPERHPWLIRSSPYTCTCTYTYTYTYTYTRG